MPEKYSVTSVLNAWVGICDIISGYLCEEGGGGWDAANAFQMKISKSDPWLLSWLIFVLHGFVHVFAIFQTKIRQERGGRGGDLVRGSLFSFKPLTSESD